jgi:apolipoprotein D and lipocalin family protein
MELERYLGKWYQLAHYPSWFDRSDNYNTTAEYTATGNNTISVRNRSIADGKVVESTGTGTYRGNSSFRVDFPIPEVENVNANYGYPSGSNQPFSYDSPANYVIVKLWTCECGDYKFSLVSDPERKSMYLLSRTPHPDLDTFNHIMRYVIAHFDRSKIVYTPHY